MLGKDQKIPRTVNRPHGRQCSTGQIAKYRDDGSDLTYSPLIELLLRCSVAQCVAGAWSTSPLLTLSPSVRW